MGKVTEMRVLTKVESNKEVKEEVGRGGKDNSRLSMETTKEKGSGETRVRRNSTKHQIAPSRAKNERIKWKQRREPEEQLFQLWKATTLQQKLPRKKT
jgi:hypothetical protein